MTGNWLTKKPLRDALNSTLFLVLILLAGSSIYLFGYFGADKWMSANAQSVFQGEEYWRAWTTLFAHADFGHIASNLFLFIPFAYFLTGYFGYLFFPIIAFFTGGLLNLLVMKTMPPHVGLIGVSGVVYWMGAAWMTLSFLIDRRESTGRSLVKITAISAILFIPDSFKASVSYLSHFGGFIMGFLSALVFYFVNFKRLRSVDEFISIPLEDDHYLEHGNDHENDELYVGDQW